MSCSLCQCIVMAKLPIRRPPPSSEYLQALRYLISRNPVQLFRWGISAFRACLLYPHYYVLAPSPNDTVNAMPHRPHSYPVSSGSVLAGELNISFGGSRSPAQYTRRSRFIPAAAFGFAMVFSPGPERSARTMYVHRLPGGRRSRLSSLHRMGTGKT